jgi:small subunit ribosomal protein S9
MADDEPIETDEQPLEPTEQRAETPTDPQAATPAESATEEASTQDAPPAEQSAAAEVPAGEPVAEEIPAEPVAEEPVAEESPAEPIAEEAPAEPVAQDEPASDEPVVEEAVVEEDEAEEEAPTPRVKPSVPGAHLEVDIVPEGVDPLAPEQPADPYALDEEEEAKSEEDGEATRLAEPISSAAIDLAAGARYKATGKRKTAIARVILRPGSGTYLVNGRTLDEHFPRVTLQRNIRQPLETVGYQERMDVVARLHGGGISAQAGALRHGISRALLEADPNLRGELKRRGFLTRDSRAKERKKAGLKKARKRPQFSKR